MLTMIVFICKVFPSHVYCFVDIKTERINANTGVSINKYLHIPDLAVDASQPRKQINMLMRNCSDLSMEKDKLKRPNQSWPRSNYMFYECEV